LEWPGFELLLSEGNSNMASKKSDIILEEKTPDGQAVSINSDPIQVPGRKSRGKRRGERLNRKQINELMRSEKLFRAIFESAAIGILLLDADNEILECNEALQNMLGYDKEELSNFLGIDLVYRRDIKKVRKNDEALLKGKVNSYTVQIRLKKSNRRLLWVKQTINRIDVEEGDHYFLATIENIDQRVKAERKLAQRAEELSRSNAELEQFAYIASHDLQEPLRTISSFVQLLQRRYGEDLDDDARMYIDMAVGGTVRMQALIKDLLQYSRVQQSPESKELIDMNTVLEEVGTNLKNVAEANSAEVLSELLPSINANRVQMIQLFQNLIDNAIKFRTEENPEVLISVQEQGSRYHFTVRDNGIGINPEFQDKIFSIFQRLHGRDEYEGTGIGLAVCKKIVEHHGGRIWIDSKVESGTSFNFTLKK
jgi:PAS domain S-box-containing protein